MKQSSTLDLHRDCGAGTEGDRQPDHEYIVRDVAKHLGAELLDLDELISGSPRIHELMLADGIHFTPVGTALVGSYVGSAIDAHRGNPTGEAPR